MADELGRSVGKRRDSRATRQRLLDAVGRLCGHGAEDLSLPVVAEEAGVSTATAYRYFGSAEDALRAYTIAFPDAVAESLAARSDTVTGGLDRFGLWCMCWIELVDSWGPALVHLRSTEGFLARRKSGDATITRVCAHVEPILVDALDELGLAEDHLPLALFLWNSIYDPREILDLRRTLRMTRARTAQVLLDLLLVGLSGEARA